MNFREFEDHIPPWSATINYKGRKNVKVTNTCTIDYFLFGMWALSQKIPTFVDSLHKTALTLKKIIEKIDNLNWNEPRELWINNVMQYKQNPNK